MSIIIDMPTYVDEKLTGVCMNEFSTGDSMLLVKVMWSLKACTWPRKEAKLDDALTLESSALVFFIGVWTSQKSLK